MRKPLSRPFKEERTHLEVDFIANIELEDTQEEVLFILYWVKKYCKP